MAFCRLGCFGYFYSVNNRFGCRSFPVESISSDTLLESDKAEASDDSIWNVISPSLSLSLLVTLSPSHSHSSVFQAAFMRTLHFFPAEYEEKTILLFTNKCVYSY